MSTAIPPEETDPVQSTGATQSDPTPELQPRPPTRRRPLLGVILSGIALVLLLGAGGAYYGYQTALAERQARQASQVAFEASKQYELGLQDQREGRLLVARSRFERVIQLDPNFPGATDRLKEVMFAMSITNTPTPEPTPTLTPTPDLRGAEELFGQAKQYLAEENWQAAYDTLEALRKEDATFRTVEVDGMYFIALRNRGVQKISEGNLEMGLYDLALAERFGYLDGQALGLRVVTRLYLTGASFWEVDWGQAAAYFAEIYPLYPSLRDHSGMTAKERYRISTARYGDVIALAGDPCAAVAQYEASLQIGSDPTVENQLTTARQACEATRNPPPPPPPAEATPGGEVSPTAPGEVPPPVETPAPPPAEVPTATPPPG